MDFAYIITTRFSCLFVRIAPASGIEFNSISGKMCSEWRCQQNLPSPSSIGVGVQCQEECELRFHLL